MFDYCTFEIVTGTPTSSATSGRVEGKRIDSVSCRSTLQTENGHDECLLLQMTTTGRLAEVFPLPIRSSVFPSTDLTDAHLERARGGRISCFTNFWYFSYYDVMLAVRCYTESNIDLRSVRRKFDESWVSFSLLTPKRTFISMKMPHLICTDIIFHLGLSMQLFIFQQTFNPVLYEPDSYQGNVAVLRHAQSLHDIRICCFLERLIQFVISFGAAMCCPDNIVNSKAF